MAEQNDSAPSTPPRLPGADPVSKRDRPAEDRSAWVQLAYEAGVESVKAQREELSGMRTRALAFTAFVATGTAFLVGRGVGPGVVRDDAFVAWAITGTISFGVLAILLVLMVGPLIKFRFILEPDLLMAWVEGDKRAPSQAVALRVLVTDLLPGMIAWNEKRLIWIRAIYMAVLVIALATLGIWMTIVLVYG